MQSAEVPPPLELSGVGFFSSLMFLLFRVAARAGLPCATSIGLIIAERAS